MVKAAIKYLFLIALPLLLGGCDMALLNPKGAIAVEQRHLFIVSLLLMLIVVIPVFIMIALFARRYRASNTKAKYRPNFAHSVKLELIWWIVPCIIIAILATITWISTHKLDPYRPLATKAKTITIQVIALNWKWLFIYPQLDIATVNFIQFPLNTQLKFLITADAPMNSFIIPQLGSQIYAMEGMQTKLHLIANHIGDYRGMSANYSGDGFSGMHFIARASSKRDFRLWLKKVRQSSNNLTPSAYKNLVKPSSNNAVTYYSAVAPDLFHKVINQYMAHKNLKTSSKKQEAVL